MWAAKTSTVVTEGKGVDIIGYAHNAFVVDVPHYVDPDLGGIKTIISTEALEHDRHWQLTLHTMWKYLEAGGLLVITAGGIGRPEHGTKGKDEWCSPDTTDYYQNISNKMFASVLPPELFTTYFIRQINTDFQFYGIKK
jgi:hypothetical protein